MKLVYTFFLFLCCYLPGRFGHAASSSHDFNICCVHAAGAQKEKAAGLAATPGHVITATAGLDQEENEFLCLEDEADEYVPKKPISRYDSTFPHISFSGRHTFSYPLFFCRHLSYIDAYKYISQRVLRI
jgi:hypothetical protein